MADTLDATLREEVDELERELLLSSRITTPERSAELDRLAERIRLLKQKLAAT